MAFKIRLHPNQKLSLYKSLEKYISNEVDYETDIAQSIMILSIASTSLVDALESGLDCMKYSPSVGAFPFPCEYDIEDFDIDKLLTKVRDKEK